jgi:hypothetical protein
LASPVATQSKRHPGNGSAAQSVWPSLTYLRSGKARLG